MVIPRKSAATNPTREAAPLLALFDTAGPGKRNAQNITGLRSTQDTRVGACAETRIEQVPAGRRNCPGYIKWRSPILE